MDGIKVFRRAFTNYCSLGIDGRIGYSFDRHRSDSRLVNQFVYVAIGMSKFCDSANKMRHLIARMEELRQPMHFRLVQEVYDEMMGLTKYDPQFQPKQDNHIVFDNLDVNSPLTLNGDFENLLALNINSLMGGVTNMWNTSKVAVSNTPNSRFMPQSFRDGQL